MGRSAFALHHAKGRGVVGFFHPTAGDRRALAYAAAATQLAARAALDALRLTNDPAAWALGDAAYWAARAAAQAARALGDERTADYTDGVADDLVALAESAGHVIRR